jgi:hypothetical protein
MRRFIYRGYSSFFSINGIRDFDGTWFIFIEWYENKYFMSGGSHEWNMITFMPQDEKNHVFIEKLEFSVYYLHLPLF